MTERDQIPGVFCRLILAIRAVANMLPLWWRPSIIIASVSLRMVTKASARASRNASVLRITDVRFASGVDMGQLRHTYFFKCGWKLHGRVRASSCGAMIFSHAVRHALVQPAWRKSAFCWRRPLPHEIATWKCQSLQTTTSGTLHQNLQLHGRTTAAMLRELITFRQASTTRNQYHLYIVAGDPRRYLSANSVAVFFHNGFIDNVMARFLRRIAQSDRKVSSSSPRRLETVRIAIRVRINSVLT